MCGKGVRCRSYVCQSDAAWTALKPLPLLNWVGTAMPRMSERIYSGFTGPRLALTIWRGSIMSSLVVSSKGQVVLPAALRRRLGMGAGARLEVVEVADGITLRVVRAVPRSDVRSLAGMLKAPTRGVPRSLDNFDAAHLVRRETR